MERSKKQKCAFNKERGHKTGILAAVTEFQSSQEGISGNFVETESKICGDEGLGMEFRDESQIPSPYFTQGAKLQMTSSLFSMAKQISLK